MGMNQQNETYQLKHKLSTASNLVAEGKFLHAIQIYNSVIDAFPAEKETYYKLISLYEKLNNIEAAHTLLKELLEQDPEDKELRLYIAHFLFRNEFWDETLEVLEFITPEEDPIVSFFNGYCHYMLKDYDLASISFEKLVALKRDSEFAPDAYIHLAKICIIKTDYDKALGYMKMAELYFGSHYEVHLLYAIIHSYLGMNEHAVTRIQKALKFKKIDPAVYEWAGKIYLKTNDHKKANTYFNKYLDEAQEPSPDVYAQMGLIRMLDEKYEEAKEYIETALKLDPENHLALTISKNIPSVKNK